MLFDNTILEELPHQSSDILKNSVVLNGNQRWVNYWGDWVTAGSTHAMERPLVTDAFVMEVHQFGGKTYALASVQSSRRDTGSLDKGYDRISRAAVSIGAHFYVPSNQEEFDNVGSWTKGFFESLRYNSDVEERLGVDCVIYEEVCNVLRRDFYVSGLKWDGDDVISVTGEDLTFLETSALAPDRIEHFRNSFLNNSERDKGWLEILGRSQWIYPYLGGTFMLEMEGDFSREEVQNTLNAEIKGTNLESSGNAVLNQWHDPNIYHWTRFTTPSADQHSNFYNSSIDLREFYWGGVSEELIRKGIFDYQNDFNKMPLKLSPVSAEPSADAYPFLASLDILDADGNEREDSRFAAEPTIWRLTFNRDMDQDVQPFVTFGPDVPYTDVIVSGSWVDARTWEGRVNISPVATDGYQYVRVAGAVAADDPWLVTGDDKRRFRFEVITSGTESLNLQASGGEGYVDLSWNQDDYDTLMGFNIYRSTSVDGTFQRINQTLVGNEDRDFLDTNVEPGVEYFYYFTVALDGSESEASNTASARPVDTIKPILTHNVISTAPFGSTVLVQANVTDNIGVQNVTLYYRSSGDSNYTSLEMANISGDDYRASIPASATKPPGVDYYIAATDGASYAYSGRSTSPNTISVENKPVITGVTPSTGSSDGGDTITISGNNFVEGASVLLGNANAKR